MTREELKELVLSYKHKHTILQLPTGYGKSRIALEMLNLRYPEAANVLIVAPKLVLFDTWKAEINKWFPENKWDITFTTYVSFPKHSARSWDMIIFDECHHITERVKYNYYRPLYKNTIYLSATIKKELTWWIKTVHQNKVDFIKLTLKNAIDDDVLPEPLVYLIPMTLDDRVVNQTYVKNKKAKTVIEVPYLQRNKYWRRKDIQLRVKCTESQYNAILENQIEFYKNLYMNSQAQYQKNIWLHIAGERLKYLSGLKEQYIKRILKKLSKQRVITFCGDIKQTERLGKNSINSKSKDSSDVLNNFNNNKINHITCCNMLNEGVNLVNCQIGIWAMYNSSSIMIIQKIGRLLRHDTPIVILPYYIDTREEEIVKKMLENFSENHIKIVKNINEIRV